MTGRLTSKQVEGDIYKMLKGSILDAGISGSVYRSGTRPRDSKAEDAVVQFVTGLAGQVQSGVALVSIYFNDTDPYSNGVLTEDGARGAEIETLAQQWVDSLTTAGSNYIFHLAQSIHTSQAEDTGQHYVAVRLEYRHCDGNA